MTSIGAVPDRGRLQRYFRWLAEDHASFRLLFGSGGRRDGEFSSAVRRVTAAAAVAVAPLIDVDIERDCEDLLAPGRDGQPGHHRYPGVTLLLARHD